MSVCVCVCPVYMSCVHRSTVHHYKLCIVVQYICMWIYIYKLVCLWVCPGYMSCPFLIHRYGVGGRTWAFPVSGNEIWTFFCSSLCSLRNLARDFFYRYFWKKPRSRWGGLIPCCLLHPLVSILIDYIESEKPMNTK